MTSAESNRPMTDDPTKSPHSSFLLILLVVVGALMLFLSLVYKRQSPIGTQHPGVGGHLGSVKLEPLLNAEQGIDTYDLRGKVVLIDFWGPWCGYCLKEFPELLPLEHKYRGRDDVQFLLVSYAGDPKGSRDELLEDSSEVLRSFNADTPIFYDPQAQLIQEVVVSARLQGFGFPTTVVLDRQGKVRAIWTGQSSVSDFGRTIEQLLAENAR